MMRNWIAKKIKKFGKFIGKKMRDTGEQPDGGHTIIRLHKNESSI